MNGVNFISPLKIINQNSICKTKSSNYFEPNTDHKSDDSDFNFDLIEVTFPKKI